MDSTYPTTKIKEENDEAGASTSIKLEKPDLDDETNDDSVGFEEVHTWVGSSSADHMEIDNNEPSGSKPIKKEKVIKHDSDLGDQASCDILDRIKKEPDPEEWDELNPTIDIPDKVELEDLTAVGVKVEPGDELDTSIKKEEMDTTQLNEEVDIKPDELPNADVDRDTNANCDFQTAFQKSLTEQRFRLTPSKIYDCPHCEAPYHHKIALNQHILREHPSLAYSINGKIHKCPDCTYTTAIKHLFSKHMLHHSQTMVATSDSFFSCVHCSVKFKSIQIHDDHVMKRHPQHLSSVTSETFECHECPYKTTVKDYLRRHISSTHKVAPSSFNLNICIHCGTMFNNIVRLDDHIVRTHPEFMTTITRKIYRCSNCSYKTVRKTDMDKHLLNQHGAVSNCETNKCKICNITFARKMNLDDHVLKKHSDYEFTITSKIRSCPECPYKTTIKSSLDKHMLSTHKKDD